MNVKPNPEHPASLPEWLFIGGLVLIFGLIVLHAPLSVFFESHFGHALLIKSWKEILMGGLAVLGAAVVTKRRVWGRFVRDPILITSAVLALLYVVNVQYGHGFKPYAAGLLIDLRYVLFADLVYVALRLFPGSRQLFVRIGLIGACIVIGFGVLQLFLPKDFLSALGYGPATITPYTTVDSDPTLPRLQSTLRGPNPLGAYAMGAVLVASGYLMRGYFKTRRWLGALAVFGIVVLIGSYSRSALIGLAVGLFVGAGIIAGKRLLRPRVIAAVILVAAVACAGLYALRGTPFYASVFKHDVAGSGPSLKSDEGHSQSLSDGLRAVAARPFGYGTGSTGSASLLSDNGYIVENQYLYVAHEAGWAALALFLVLAGLLLKRAYAARRDPLALGVFMSGLGLLAVGLLLPVFADDTVSIVWFGLAGLVAALPTVGSTRERAAK